MPPAAAAALLLAPTAAAAAAEAASVSCAARRCGPVRRGAANASATASAVFDDSVDAKGWAALRVATREGAADDDAAFAAGYIEAALTTRRSAQHLRSYFETTFPNGTGDPLYAAARDFLEANDAYMRRQCASGTAARGARCLVWAQLDGLVAGHAAHAAAADALTRLDFLFANALVDLSSVIHKPFLKEEWTAERAALYTRRTTHCSAIVRLSADLGHLWTSHNTWTGYYTMLRVAKTYDMPLSGVRARTTVFSGYFATLSSLDDFFVLSSGLVVQETTNPLYNTSLAAEIVPQATLTWARTIAANRGARDGAEWTSLFAEDNSGTINNQWMVVDYNRFTPFRPLPPGTLTILEQWPGFVETTDVTQYLNVGYWQSFNRPFFRRGRAQSGGDDMFARFGNGYSYALNPRAKIFRRDAGKIESRDDLKRFVRYNQWQTDPFSANGYGGAGEPPSAENAIAARCDLVAAGSTAGEGRAAFGNTDAKIADEADVRALRFEATSGPTHDDQPVFEWAGEWASSPHHGQPRAFDFGWFNFSADMAM